MQYRYTINRTEKGYDGFFKIDRHWVSFEKFDGGFIDNVIRECGRKGDIVGVLPYDPVRQEFLMVEQFRIGMMVRGEHPWTLEIVAGFMDVPGETPLATAKRELLEETGCTAISIHPLIEYYPGPGGSGSKNHVFIAEVNAETAAHHTGITAEGEDIRVHRIPLATIKQQTENGELGTSTAIIAFQQFFIGGWQKRLSNAASG